MEYIKTIHAYQINQIIMKYIPWIQTKINKYNR